MDCNATFEASGIFKGAAFSQKTGAHYAALAADGFIPDKGKEKPGMFPVVMNAEQVKGLSDGDRISVTGKTFIYLNTWEDPVSKKVKTFTNISFVAVEVSKQKK